MHVKKTATKCSAIFIAKLVPLRQQFQKDAAWYGIGFFHIHPVWLSSSKEEDVAGKSLGVFKANKFWQP